MRRDESRRTCAKLISDDLHTPLVRRRYEQYVLDVRCPRSFP
jgi:hypothetical protein